VGSPKKKRVINTLQKQKKFLVKDRKKTKEKKKIPDQRLEEKEK